MLAKEISSAELNSDRMAVSILSNSSPVHSSSIQFPESCTSTSKTAIDESSPVGNDVKNNKITSIPDCLQV